MARPDANNEKKNAQLETASCSEPATLDSVSHPNDIEAIRESAKQRESEIVLCQCGVLLVESLPPRPPKQRNNVFVLRPSLSIWQTRTATDLNRPVQTRMPGGMGGAQPKD